MKLNRLQQACLFVLGVGVFGLGVTASIREWSAAGVVILVLPGLLFLVFALVGVFPNVHLKEGNIDWPRSEEEKPENSTANVEIEEVAQLRKELDEVRTRLEDYILANEPVRADDKRTDEERLREIRRFYEELDTDVSAREFSGEGDDKETEQARKIRDEVRAGLLKEERRQWAQYTFGMRDTPPEPSP